MIFGLSDCSVVTFLFLPLFGQRTGDKIEEFSLLCLTQHPGYIKIPYLILVVGLALCVTGCFFCCFYIWTVAIQYVDVQAIGLNGSSVGLAAFN